MNSVKEIEKALKEQKKVDALKDKSFQEKQKVKEKVRESEGKKSSSSSAKGKFRFFDAGNVDVQGKDHHKVLRDTLEKAGMENLDERRTIKRFFEVSFFIAFFVILLYFYNFIQSAQIKTGIASKFIALFSLFGFGNAFGNFVLISIFALLFTTAFIIVLFVLIFVPFVSIDTLFMQNRLSKAFKIPAFLKFDFGMLIDDSKPSSGKIKKFFVRYPYVQKGINAFAVFFVIYLSYSVLMNSFNFVFSLVSLFGLLCVLWCVVFLGSYVLIWAGFYFYVDIRVYRRKIEVEQVLPDFLQLVASNIKSGMPIDRALFYSVRPKFGVLAKEMEVIAKETLTGEELKHALLMSTRKFDSKVYQRSIALLIEGIESGGEIGDLLSKISTNIQELQMMKKEMAASVTTYVIFITFAAIVAAPFLMGLSYQLLQVIQKIMASVAASGGSSGTASAGPMKISFSADSLRLEDFKIFAYMSLAVTAFFSASICSIIKTGTIKGGLKNIPLYILVSLVIFLIAVKVLGLFFAGMF